MGCSDLSDQIVEVLSSEQVKNREVHWYLLAGSDY